MLSALSEILIYIIYRLIQWYAPELIKYCHYLPSVNFFYIKGIVARISQKVKHFFSFVPGKQLRSA